MSPISETHTVGSESYFFLSSRVRLLLLMVFIMLWSLFVALNPLLSIDPNREGLLFIGLGVLLIIIFGEVDKTRLENISFSENLTKKIEDAKRKLNYRGNASIRLVNTHRQVLTLLQLPTESIIAISPSVLKDLENNDEISETVIAVYLNQTHWMRRVGEILLVLSLVLFFSYFETIGFFSDNHSLWSLVVYAVLFLAGIILLLTSTHKVPKIETIYGKHARMAPSLLLTGSDASLMEEATYRDDAKIRPKLPWKKFLAISIAVGLGIALVFFIPLFILTQETGNIHTEMFMMLIEITIISAVVFPLMLFMLFSMSYMLWNSRKFRNEEANRAATEGSRPYEINQSIREILGLDYLTAHWLDDETGARYISVISTKRSGSSKPFFNVHSNLIPVLEYPNELTCYVISRIMEKQLYRKYQILYGLAMIPFLVLQIAGFLVTITNLDEIFNFLIYMVWGVVVCIPLIFVVFYWHRKKRRTNDLDLYIQRPVFLTVLRKLVSGKFSPAVESESYEKRLNRLEQNLQKVQEDTG
ncbi:hypothetical protein E4H12_10720 [Candidatus Thorarchaeota archaeon]|nr:MAG: hypothetical protein E4H12_10720 [Candidatus Thorarchaeota archaeon]